MTQELHTLLGKGILQLGLSIEETIQNQLIQYLELLFKWNKAYNLTSVRRKNLIVSVHLLDSLAITPYISGNHIADIGTGAGLPGIVLALCFPEKHFVLVDSNSKKTRFVNQALTELQCHNVTVLHSRIEDYQCETSFDQIVSRAYTSLQTFIKSTCHVATKQTEYLSMKGQIPENEIEELGQGFITKSLALNVPNVEGQRHLIIMTSK